MGLRNPSQVKKSGLILLDEIEDEIIGQTNVGTTTIPNDNTPPQISEGNLVFDMDYIPRKIGSIIKVESFVPYRPYTGTTIGIYALFIDDAVDAVRVATAAQPAASDTCHPHLYYKFTSTALVSINFKFRIGAPGINVGDISVGSSGQNFGNTIRSWARIQEWAPPGLL